ncbi:hypothetical protein ASPCAL00613 [Aspergillus calidoustus]|uniref:Short-chain dehydrogenase n=1 Tax=Aspergillus calidoustus TaxID=454130 RepID=A0A0U5FQY9_ASPCI|nr:hypothetical protein ASPCAL00613 [Aspergillus calidoustus]
MTDLNFHTEAMTVVKRWGDRIHGKTVVITGTSEGGLGATTALALAHAQPSKIFLLARNERKVSNVIKEIKEISPSTQVPFVSIELDDFDSVRKAAATILALTDTIDVLINNAGVMAIPWEKNKDGIEKTLAINHLGHFLLTKRLFPAIIAAGPGSRVVNLTSAGYKMGPFRFDDWNFSDGREYNPFASYAQSKTANILFTVALAKRAKDHGVLAFAVHPGYIPDTSLTKHMASVDADEMNRVSLENTGGKFAPDEPKSLQQGAATSIVAALSPDLASHSGAYLADCQIEEVRGYANDSKLAGKLWEISEKLVGESFGI